MRHVTPFEARLLRILHATLGHAPASQALALIVQEAPRPPCLSRGAVELVQDALRKGITARLARGGWRRERFLQGEASVEGRLWRRRAPQRLALGFSGQSLDFLFWLTAANAEEASRRWRPRDKSALTIGDRLLLISVYEVVRLTEIGAAWSRGELFTSDGLCRLLFPNDFADHPGTPAPDFSIWLADDASWVLEALQDDLARRWIEVERDKGRIVSPDRMRRLAHAQTQTLGAFFLAAENANRRDLARFTLIAAERLLAARPARESWTQSLNVGSLRLMERQEVYADALSFLRLLDHVQGWNRWARGVGYLDEGYAAAQLFKSDWERLGGDRLMAAAQQILRYADPLRGH